MRIQFEIFASGKVPGNDLIMNCLKIFYKRLTLWESVRSETLILPREELCASVAALR